MNKEIEKKYFNILKKVLKTGRGFLVAVNESEKIYESLTNKEQEELEEKWTNDKDHKILIKNLNELWDELENSL